MSTRIPPAPRPRPKVSLAFAFLCTLAVLLIPTTEGRAQEHLALLDAPVVHLAADDYQRYNALLDVNGDGYLDAIGYYFETVEEYNVTVWLNDTTGRFVEAWQITLDGELDPGDGLNDRIPLAVGDVSGYPGFVMATREHGLRFYRFEDTSGQPTLWRVEPNGGSPSITDVRIADFNGDGLGDVAAIRPATRLRVYLSEGVSLPPTQILTDIFTGIWLTVAEVNGDGSPDLVLVDTHVIELCPIVDGIPTLGQTYPTLLGNGKLLAGDIDVDGDEDLIYFTEPPANLEFQVFRRDGADAYIVEAVKPGGPAYLLVDLDGDGDLDGACCGGGGGGGGGGPPPQLPNDNPATFFISINDGTGQFSDPYTFPGLGANHIAGAGDIDLDGDMDLVAGRVVYYGGPDSYRHPEALGGNYSITYAEDIDSDGDADALFGLQDYYFTGNGDGTFVERTLELPEAPAGTTFRSSGYPGDWNGDGVTDVIVEHHQGGQFLGMRLILNNGNGDLVDGGPAGDPGVEFTRLGSSAGSLHTHQRALDADGDGDLDFCALQEPFFTGPGKIWWNDGTGFFTDGPTFPGRWVYEAADLNGNGRTDLLTRTRNSGSANFTLAYHRGLVGGGYGNPIHLVNQDQNTDALVRDLDADGDVDIALVARDESDLRLLINDGSGQFAHQFPFPGATPEEGTFAVHWADLNGDGFEDLATNTRFGFSDSRFTIYLKTGPGLEWEPEPLTQLIRPAVLADYDGDGDPDAMTVQRTFARNRTHEGVSAGARKQYGTGLAGSAGHVPLLGARGPFRPGSSREFFLRNGLGGARAGIIVGPESTEMSRRGGILYVDPRVDPIIQRFRLSGPTGVPGAGFHSLSYPDVAPQYAGRTFHFQFGVFDPEAPQGVALSNALEIRFGE